MPRTCKISIHLKTSEVLFNSRLAETEGPAHEGRHEGKYTVIYLQQFQVWSSYHGYVCPPAKVTLLKLEVFCDTSLQRAERVVKEHNDPSQKTGSLVIPCHNLCTLKHNDESILY